MTMMGLFSSLGVKFLDADRDELPEFSSLILVELWRTEEDEFVVKWKYRRPTVLNGELIELDIGNGTLTDLHELAQTMRVKPDPKTVSLFLVGTNQMIV
jgi:hypothetical protein